MVWCSFDSNLCSLFSIRVPLVPICVTLSTSSPPYEYILPLSTPPHFKIFCKESLITPPPPPPTQQPTSSLFAVTVTPPKIFIVLFPSFSIHVHSFSIRVHSCSFVFHSCSLVFIRVHSYSFMFTRVHLCSIRVPLVFIRVPLVFTRVPLAFHSCSFVFTRIHSCSFVFIRVHSCSFVFRSVWCFRYDPHFATRIRSSRKQNTYFELILDSSRICLTEANLHFP